MISYRRITVAAGHRMPRVQRSPLEEEVHVSPASMTQKYSTLSPSLAVGIDEPDRNLALETVPLPEAPAIAGRHWGGIRDQDQGGRAAVHALRSFLQTVHFN